MAVSAIDTGVTTVEVRAATGSGGTATSAGLRSLGAGWNALIAQTAPANEPMAIRPPIAILPQGRLMPINPLDFRET
jgi:hypothetical protein